MRSANTINRVTLTGWFALDMPPSSRGREGPSRLMPLAIPQRWQDPVSGEFMNGHFWVDLLFVSMPEYLIENLKSGRFTGAVVHGALEYRRSGEPPREKIKAVVVVDSIQLIDRALSPEDKLRPGAPPLETIDHKGTNPLWTKQLKPKPPIPLRHRKKTYLPRYLR